MAEQLTGAASALVLILAYLLIVECFMAGAILLGQFIVVQVANLTAVVRERPPRSPGPAPVVDDQGESYRVGGGLMRW